MSRGARKDTAVTKLLYANGLLLDKRSFVSLNANEPHLYLKGADMSAQRERVIKRDDGKCRKCGHNVASDYGEVHHVIHKGQLGYDDLCNLEWRCGRWFGDCHKSEHVAPRWTPRGNAR